MSLFQPTDEQKIALEAPLPLLVLAGAGTGKTTVLTRRIAQTIASGEARPDQVLALTFTDKAAAEMADRLAEVLREAGLADSARDVAVSTFHSFGGSIIRENLLRLGFDRPPTVLTTPASWQLLVSIFDDLQFDGIDIPTGNLSSLFSQLLHFFSSCKDHLVTPDSLDVYLAVTGDTGLSSTIGSEYLQDRLAKSRDAVAAYRRFESAKRERSAIDFGDHLMVPVQMMESDTSLRDSYRRRYRYIFVDEYQDTNHAQRLLLLQLIDPDRPNVMVIGDDDQSIYGWRGAVVQNILRFDQEKVFGPGRVTSVTLMQNRRSFPKILDLAKRAIGAVADRHRKDLTYYPGNKTECATIGHHLASSDVEEAEWIAAQIQSQAEAYRAAVGKKKHYGAFTVLCRKRRLFVPIGQAFDQAGVPYELVGGTGFYGRWEIRDVISYLRLLADTSDDVACARVLRSRRWRISSRDVSHLGRWVSSHNNDHGRESVEQSNDVRLHLFDAVRNLEEVESLSADARERLHAWREEMQRFDLAQSRLSLQDLIAMVIEGSGYQRELLARPGVDSRVAMLNLGKLQNMAREFAAAGQVVRLKDFVEYISFAVDSEVDEGEVRPVDEESDTVKVMTIHQAKGLEFPVVFLPGLSTDEFPIKPRGGEDAWSEVPLPLRGDREHLAVVDVSQASTKKELDGLLKSRKAAENLRRLDEERRLFYVAITRAQSALYFSRAHWYRRLKKPKMGSEFWEVVVDSGLSDDLGQAECPADNPNRVTNRDVPSPAADLRRDRPDNLSRLLLNREEAEIWISQALGQEDTGRWLAARAKVDEHLHRLKMGAMPSAPATRLDISCTGILTYLACPRRYQYIYIDHFPVRPSPRAWLGTRVHARIEELSRPADAIGPTSREPEPLDPDSARDVGHDLDDLVEESLEAPPEQPTEHFGTGGMSNLIRRFQNSDYGRRSATFVEWPFVVPLRSGTLRGRCDRLDLLPDGSWCVVDYKTGSHNRRYLATYERQMAMYALAVSSCRNAQPDQIDTHLFFLGDGQDLQMSFDGSRLDQTRDEIEWVTDAIIQRRFPYVESVQHCPLCDYCHVCGRESTE